MGTTSWSERLHRRFRDSGQLTGWRLTGILVDFPSSVSQNRGSQLWPFAEPPPSSDSAVVLLAVHLSVLRQQPPCFEKLGRTGRCRRVDARSPGLLPSASL